MMIIMMGLIVTLYTIDQSSFPKLAESKCEEIGMELFDYNSGNMFTQSSITCINKTTNEIKKIR